MSFFQNDYYEHVIQVLSFQEMLEAYPNEKTPLNVLFDESPALHTNKFYKTGPVLSSLRMRYFLKIDTCCLLCLYHNGPICIFRDKYLKHF